VGRQQSPRDLRLFTEGVRQTRETAHLEGLIGGCLAKAFNKDLRRSCISASECNVEDQLCVRSIPAKQYASAMELSCSSGGRL